MTDAPAVIINLPGYPFNNFSSVASISALRAMSSVFLADGQDIGVDGSSGPGGLFSWDASSTANDDGSFVIKPNDVSPLAAGRWVLGEAEQIKASGTLITPERFGALGGSSDDTLAIVTAAQFAALAGQALFVFMSHRITYSISLECKVIFLGGKFNWPTGVTVQFTKGIQADDNGRCVGYPLGGHCYIYGNRRVCDGWLDIPADGSADISYFKNDMVFSSDALGRLHQHTGGAYRLSSPVDIGMAQFQSFQGYQDGLRSNIEYEKAPPVGGGASVEFPGGGCAYWIDANNNIGFRLNAFVPPYVTPEFRVSGLSFKGLTIIGSRSATVNQSAIALFGPTDGTRIEKNVIINFHLDYGVVLWKTDAVYVEGNWIAECKSNLIFDKTNVEGIVIGNRFGAESGDCLYLNGCEGFTVEGNNFFYGARDIVMNQSYNCNIKNKHTGHFTGRIVLIDSNTNSIEAKLQVVGLNGNDNATPDPLGRGKDYGLVFVGGSSGDNVFRLNIDGSYQVPTDYVAFNINTTGGGNRLYGGNVSGVTSTQKLVVAAATQRFTVRDFCKQAEAIIVTGAGYEATWQTV